MNAFRISRDRLGLSLLAADIVLLGTVLAWLFAAPRPRIPPAQPVELAALLNGHSEPAALDPSSLADIYALLVGQPLFHQDRKYTPPPAVDTAAVQSAPPDFLVTGYLEIPGRPSKAYLRERSGGRALTVTVGDSVDGWSVVGLAPKQVGLRQGERTINLTRLGAPVMGLASQANSPAATGVFAAQSPLHPALQGANSPTLPLPAQTTPAVPAPPNVTTSAARQMPPIGPLPATHPQALMRGTQIEGVTVFGNRLPVQDQPADSGRPIIVSPQGPMHTYSQPSQSVPH